MARRAFYSFHYNEDNWRASQVRNMGVIEGNRPATDNEWEQVKKGGDSAIQKWIAGQVEGKSVVIVLAGTNTANRKWVNYEIEYGWKEKKGVLCVHIHNLKNKDGKQSSIGGNPLRHAWTGAVPISTYAKTYDPPYTDSEKVYNYIKNNLASWIEEAIKIRDSKP